MKRLAHRIKTFLVRVGVMLVVLNSATSGLSQNLYTSVIPPSPNVASLGKYGEIPVGLYTGIPNISIPLFEARSGNLSLPVSISYHAGGVRVEEMASSVGLGFTLNAGGIVGRSVKGYPDEIRQWQPQPTANQIETIMASGNTLQLIRDVQNGIVDGEADLYFFNFGRYSGKFFYDQSGTPHTVPYMRMDISEVPVGGFRKMVTEDGTVYLFEKTETINSSSGNSEQIVTSAWHLTRITSADGRHNITLSYETINYNYFTLTEQVKNFSVSGGACLPTDPPALVSNQNYLTYRLKRIDFEEGYLKFNYINNRCDLWGDKSLDQIELYNLHNTFIKRVNFTYGYFGADNGQCSFDDVALKRLKLLSLTEQVPSYTKPPHIFTYNETELPSRLSNAQDHWGYFNGVTTNSSMVPAFTTIVFSGTSIFIPGADRRTYPDKAQAGVLTGIVYPTGGQTQFTYESNRVNDQWIEPQTVDVYMPLSSGPNPSISSYPVPYRSNIITIPLGGAQVTVSVTGLENVTGCEHFMIRVLKNGTSLFTLGNTGSPVVTAWPEGTYQLELDAECYSWSVIGSWSAYVIAKIPVVGDLSERSVGGLRIKKIEDIPGNGKKSVVKNFRYTLPEDDTKTSGILTSTPVYMYDLLVLKAEAAPEGGKEGPTLQCQYRVIKSSSCYPLATTQGSYVGYSHVIVDYGDNGQSRSAFTAYADLGTHSYPFAPIESYDWRRGQLIFQEDYEKKGSQLIRVKRVENYYTAFSEHRIYGLKTGKNIMLVSNTLTDLHDPIGQFYPVITEFNYLYRTKEINYNPDDGSKFHQKTTDYTYNPTHLQLSSITVSTTGKTSGTTDEIITSIKYPFDYSFSGSPVGEEAMGIKKLQDLRVSNQSLEQVVMRQQRNASYVLSNQRIVSGLLTTFRPDFPYPEKIFKLEIGVPVLPGNFGTSSAITGNELIKNPLYKPEMIFSDYDDRGNLREQYKANDQPHSYIWGYDKLHPIAEVTNAKANDIVHTSFEDGNGNSMGGVTGEMYLNGTYNNSVTGLTNGPYVLSYWKLINSEWIFQNTPVTVSNQSFTINISGQIDEVRFIPLRAQMKTLTYKPLIGTTSVCDANNIVNYYLYDEFYRLKLIKDRKRNILKFYKYHYAGEENYND